MALIELLDTIATRQRAATAERLMAGRSVAPDFDLFRFCRTDELGLSEIIRWMLDPRETHRQGTVFLECFFKIFGIDHRGRAVLERASARTEVATHKIDASRRRIDIEVRCGGFILAIENKPYAVFQKGQVPDYCAHLESEASNGFAMVILKGWCEPAPMNQRLISGQQDAWIVDSDYAQLALWVEACAALCQATNVKLLLSEFHRFIEATFQGGVTMHDQKLILLEVNSADRQRAALDLIASAGTLYRKLHSDFVTAVKAARKRGWTVSPDGEGRAGRRNSGFFNLTIDFSADFPVLFAFDVFEYGTEASIAVVEKASARNSVRRCKRIIEKLRERLPASGPQTHWLWWEQQHQVVEADLLKLDETNI